MISKKREKPVLWGFRETITQRNKIIDNKPHEIPRIPFPPQAKEKNPTHNNHRESQNKRSS